MTKRGLVLDSLPMDKNSSLYESVRGHYLFSGLDEENFDRLAAEMKVKDLDQGEVLFHRGDPADSFYYVDTGLIELSLIAATGDKKTLEVVNPGRTFGEAVTFMQEIKFPVTAEGLQRITAVRNSERGFPGHAAHQSRCLHAPARRPFPASACARSGDRESFNPERPASPCELYHGPHHRRADGDQATARLELPRHVIASRLSIAPETLSRLLRNLADEGIISIEDRVVFIHSLARLRPYD